MFDAMIDQKNYERIASPPRRKPFPGSLKGLAEVFNCKHNRRSNAEIPKYLSEFRSKNQKFEFSELIQSDEHRRDSE
jgi:hypothetical protein